MLHSILRTTFLAACIAGVVGCSEGTPLSPEPIDEVRVVFTESVVGAVDGTIDDASVRIVAGLADASFAAQLDANLDELSTQIAARDLARAALTLARTRAMIERTDVSQEVLDSAHDLSAVGLILDQTEMLLDRVGGRS